jgi:hypothetical protein
MEVHQCACFSASPKALHKLAVKHIVYLSAMKGNDYHLKPTPDFSLNMFVDGNYVGLWHKEYADLRNSVLCRTGYIVTFCGCQCHGVANSKQKSYISYRQ